MRAILALLAIVVIAAIALVATDLVNFEQDNPATPPTASVDENGLTVEEGSMPSFDVETGSISVGEERREVAVPTIGIEPGGGDDDADGDPAPAAQAVVDTSPAEPVNP